MTAMIKEKSGKINDDLDEEERKRPKPEPDDLNGKAMDSPDNTTGTHNNVEEAEDVIANLKKKIKTLQIRLKKKNQPKQHNQLDKLTTDSIETNDDYTSDKTELLSYDEKDNDRYDQEKNQSTTTTHDLINDYPEPNTLDEEDTNNGPTNDTSSILNDKLTSDSIETNYDYNRTNTNKTELLSYDEKGNDRYDQEKNESTTTAHDLINDDSGPRTLDDEEDTNNGPKNDTTTILNGSEYKQEDSIGITNNDNKPAVQNNSTINEENTIETAQHPSVQITNELFDEKKKPNKKTSVDTNEREDKIVEEGSMKETKSMNSEIDPPSERGLYSLQDSAIDPTEEMLDEEGIDDVGKFGRKRNLILKKKKPD